MRARLRQGSIGHALARCVLAVVAALGSTLIGAEPAAAQDVARGAALYQQWCRACHGPDASTGSPQLAAGKPQRLREAIAAQSMMRFLQTSISNADVESIAAYLATVSPNGPPPPPPAAIRTGWYWDPALSGSGYFVEQRENRVFAVAFNYAASGHPDWFLLQAPVVDGVAQGDLLQFAGGQSLTGAYKPATLIPPSATIRLTAGTGNTLQLAARGATVSIIRHAYGRDGTATDADPGFPEAGWWWNPDESGRGFALEIQNDFLFLAAFMYDAAGHAQWYTTAGRMTSATQYLGTWQAFADGQVFGGAYRAPTLVEPNAGNVRIDFTSRRAGTLTLPDGRTVPFVRSDI